MSPEFRGLGSLVADACGALVHEWQGLIWAKQALDELYP